MRILAFSDLLRDVRAASALLGASAGADIVVGAGDFATMGHGAKDTLEILAGCEVPVILVHGNHDDPEEIADLCRQFENLHHLHGRAMTIGDTAFLGLGGEIPSRNDHPWNAAESEERAAELLAPSPRDAVMVTHTPPYGVADLQSNGAHEGSVAIRDAVLRSAPKLVLCGHIHHAWGTEGHLASTLVRNLGPTANWFEV